MTKKSSTTNQAGSIAPAQVSISLGKFGRHLRGVLGKAGGNRISSSDRLTKALQRVSKDIDEILHQATLADGKNMPSHAKLDRAAKLLEAKLQKLNARYHQHDDHVRIEQFLNDQRDIISRTIEPSDEREMHLAALNDRVNSLHRIMRTERSRIKQNNQKEWLKFWITLALATVSIGISLYAVLR